MTVSTITADLPRLLRRDRPAPMAAGGGGGYTVTLLAGPVAPTKEMRRLNPGVFRHNTRTPAPFSHETVTLISNTTASFTSGWAVNHRIVAQAGTNQWGQDAGGNPSGYTQQGWIGVDPIQWLNQQGFRQGASKRTLDPAHWFTGSDFADLLTGRADDLDIVGIMQNYATRYVLLRCGLVVTIGYNGHGQIGDGAASNRNAYRVCGWSAYDASHAEVNRMYKGGRRCVQMAGTGTQQEPATTAYFLMSDGTIFSTGYNGYGQRAANMGTANDYSPRQCFREGLASRGESGVVPVEDAVYVVAACGQYGTVWYIDEQGKVWAAGRNNNYPMGTSAWGNNQTYFRPVRHGTDPNPDWETRRCLKISATGQGDNTTAVFLFDDGSVWTAGYGGYGQVMTGSTTATNNGTQVAGFGAGQTYGRAVNVWAVGGSYGNVFVATEDGRLYGAGYSGYGQLSGGRTNGTYNGVYDVGADFVSAFHGTGKPHVVKLSSTGQGSVHHVVFLNDRGETWTTGRNAQGPRGYYDASNYYSAVVPFLGGCRVIDAMATGGGDDNATVWLVQLPDGTVAPMGSGSYWVANYSWWSGAYSPRNIYNPILINPVQ